ncbi:MAG: GntR family transcriptional regulator [Candidatus Accumulibacter sp.]|jgi:GntR family transcriptional regulator|nr:GntR family transcriptional regulator [Accumulibacter sp.]
MSRSARIPRHAQISNAIRHQIDERELLPGDLLPSEADLCESFRVSRSVIRQALDTLVHDGIVKKAQGRGTMVSVSPELRRDPLRSAGLSTQMVRLGSRVSTRVLSYEIEDVPTSIRGLAGPRALRLERLRFVDDEPTAFIRTWLPCDLSALITPEILENASLHEQLYLKAGCVVSAGNRQIRATAARAPIDGLLGIPAGYPLLLLEGQSKEQNGRVIEVFSTWHRSDKIAFDISENNRSTPAVTENSGKPDVYGVLENARSLMESALVEISKLKTRLER